MSEEKLVLLISRSLKGRRFRSIPVAKRLVNSFLNGEPVSLKQLTGGDAAFGGLPAWRRAGGADALERSGGRAASDFKIW